MLTQGTPPLGVSRQRAAEFVTEETGRETRPSTLRGWAALLPGLLVESEPFSNSVWGADTFSLVAGATIGKLRSTGLTTVALRRSLLNPDRGLNQLRKRIESDRSRWTVAVTDRGCFPIDESGLSPATLDAVQSDGAPVFLHLVPIGDYARAARRLVANS